MCRTRVDMMNLGVKIDERDEQSRRERTEKNLEAI